MPPTDPRAPQPCSRAKSSMTPCVVKDGEMALADDGTCVGCGVVCQARISTEGNMSFLVGPEPVAPPATPSDAEANPKTDRERYLVNRLRTVEAVAHEYERQIDAPAPPSPVSGEAPAPLPWHEIPGESPEDRTARLLHHRPDLRDHMAYNLWCYDRGARNTVEERERWTALPDDERQATYREADRRRKGHAALSNAERAWADSASLYCTLALNDAALAAPSPSEGATPVCECKPEKGPIYSPDEAGVLRCSRCGLPSSTPAPANWLRVTPIVDADAARLLRENPARCTTGWEAMLVRHVERLEAEAESLRAARLQAEQERDRLREAVAWALGEVDDFRPRAEGEGAFWWRTELRERANRPTTKET